MGAVTVIRVGGFLARNWKKIVAIILGFFGIIFFVIAGIGGQQSPSIPFSGDGKGGKANVAPEVRKWEPVVRQYAQEFGVADYVELMLAQMDAESGGRGLDPMQSSEGPFNTKYCKDMNCITDPIYSIWAGVQEFRAALIKAKGDAKLALQGYNFGSDFIDYIFGKGGVYSQDLAIEYSRSKSSGIYSCQGRDPGNYRTKVGACYGDFRYVEKILSKMTPDPASQGNVVLGGAGGQIFDANQVYGSMAQFLGQAYVWGGATPPGFDCSGLMQWNFRQVGIKLPRTAEEQYYATARVSPEQLLPGDLVFFSGTYVGKTVTHVGMYIGNGKMINSNDSGVKIDDVFSAYWVKHYYGGGRITQ
ncbi:bifunctional lytic transglycosylase/C40 family peptidase [Bacillus mycoides]|uniref:bifunctional lytic transglycosylase/C40 family peptidase n=1 Tax=Bacillus mycoides TaxID=1405 RepID=UPI002DFF5079|nr:bifunctional lytic transglycosylase/C40 family peptidase [Bacillus mycoides]